jgi:hypothetical protein
MLSLLSFLELKPSKGSPFSLCDTSRALCMKELSLLSYVLFESLKYPSTSALLAAIALVKKSTFPPDLLFSETLKGFHDLCDSYKVPTHMKVLSILRFSVA